MIGTLNKGLLPFLCLLILIGIFTACKKDNDVNSTTTQLLSFGPTGAMHGDTLSFIGTNLNIVTEIDFTGNEAVVSQSAFVSQSAELIRVVVPTVAEQGFVTLKTPQGDIVTKTKLNLNVVSTVTSFIPHQARPGENITITGNYLNWVTAITFADGKNVDSFVSKTMTQLVVTIPMDAQTGPLVISYGGTEPMQVETPDTLNVTLPAFTSISPNLIKHAGNLTINGTNLDLVSQVLFEGDTSHIRSFVSQSATQIVVKVPASTKKGNVTLVAASGVTVKSSDILDVVLPTITEMSPNPIDSLANLTITGTNLDLVTGIAFTNVAAKVTTFVSKSADKIVVKLPSGAKKGNIVLSVLNSTLTVTSPAILTFVGDLPPLSPLAYAMYIDDFQNGWQDWGWGRTADYTNKENIRDGNASMKVEFTGEWSGIKFANSTVSTANYSELTFSIFGTPGSGGKKISVTPKEGSAYTITIEEGKWIEYKLTKANIGNPASISELTIGNQDWKGTIYIDHVGLR